MSEDIGPGDYVELIEVEAEEKHSVDDSPWVLRAIYVVSEVGKYVTGAGWLNCVGMPTPREMGVKTLCPGWDQTSFRKIYRRKSDLKETLLQGIDQLMIDERARKKTNAL